MSYITGDVLYKAVTSNNIPYASQLILELKAHVKRDLVNLSYAPRFFDALLIAAKVPTLAINSFSTICHLVKRISIQDPNVLKLVDFQVVPFLIDLLADEKLSIKNTSKKAMINYWQSVPDEFEVTLKNYGLTHKNSAIRNEILIMLYEIVDNNPGFGFKIFLPSIVELMNDTDPQVLMSATELLRLFFKDVNPNNRSAKSDLVNKLISQRVAKTLVNRLLIEIGDNELIQQYNNTINQAAFVTAGSTKITTTGSTPIMSSQSRPRSRMSNVHRLPVADKRRISSSEFLRGNTPSPGPSNRIPSNDLFPDISANPDEISHLLDSIPLYNIFEDLNPVNFADESQLLERFESMLAPFEGKETEHNWMHRERYIIQLRSILRGNGVTDYPTVLAQSIKLMKEGICKAVTSLRTTLSNNGCQLCRELGIYIGQYLDGQTVETLLSSLMKLSAARKKISHQNANIGVVGLLLYTNFGSRTMNHLVSASSDKNAQPRVYAATWIHLTLLKYKHHKQSLENSLENITNIISKGISDPTPAVKEKMRTAYWCFYQLFPDIANAMKNKLDLSSLRALDRCKPSSISAPPSEAPPSRLSGRQSRQSMKELIMAKRRDNHSNTQQTKSTIDEVFQRVSSTTSDHPRPRVSSDARSRVSSDSRNKSGKSTSRVSSIGRKSSFGSIPGFHKRGSISESRRAHSTSPQIERIAHYDSNDLDKGKGKEEENVHEITGKIVDETLKMISNLPSALSEKDEKSNDEIDEYTERIKKQSHLYELLCSEDKHAQQAGFDMIVNNHSANLSVKFNSVLDKLSISHPSIFEPMFNNNDLLKYLITYLSTDNLIRLICVHNVQQTIEADIINLIISEVASSDICLSIINILNSTIDTSRLEDLNLSMQFTKYKKQIMKCCFSLISSLFGSSSKVEVFLLGTIDEVLLKCAHITELDYDLLSVLQQSFKKDPEIFKIHLFGLENCTIQADIAKQLDISTSETQSDSSKAADQSPNVMGLENLPDMIEDDGEGIDFGGINVDGMTMVVPKSQSVTKELPKLNSDMTMIMPKFNSKPSNSNLITMGQIQEEEEIEEQNENVNPFVGPKSDDFKMTTADLFVENNDNEAPRLQSPILLPLHSNDDAMDVDSSLQPNLSLAQTTFDHEQDKLMSDSTPDINQLSLSDSHNRILPESSYGALSNPPSPPKSSREIEEIIESADPLASLTKSPERIQIYEDSPTAINSLLGFEAYIYKDYKVPEYINPSEILEKLNNSTITNIELIYLMKSLQSQRISINDIESGLLKYLNVDLNKDHIQIGMIILHSCILSNKLEHNVVFEKLIELGSILKSNEEDLYFAIEESLELLSSVSLCVNKISATKTLSNIQNELLLETIFQISNEANLSSEDIFNLDLTLFRLLKSRSTSVRKLCILIYARLLKMKNGDTKDSNGDDLIDDLVFKRLEGDKIRLVEYYVDRV